MRKRRVLLGVALAGYASVAMANEEQALQFISYCEHEIYVTKDYDQAGKICRRARQNVNNLLGPSELYLRSVINEADLEWIKGKYPDAFFLYSEAADIAESIKNKVKVKELRVRQAEADMFRGKSVDAEILMRDALKRQRAIVPRDALQEADLLSKHADILVALSQPKAAMQGYLSALEKLDPAQPEHRFVLLRTQQHYAEFFEKQNRYVGAIASYRRLLDTALVAPESLEHVKIALRRMGWISEVLGNAGDARDFYQKLLEFVEKHPTDVSEVAEVRALLAKSDVDGAKIAQPTGPN